jgi:hypothetical protein
MEDRMTIEILKYGDNYRADIIDLPGSPIGTGKTKHEAVADLFWRILHPTNTEYWLGSINFSKLEIKEIS